jgi:hypothetical protein
MMAVCRTVHMIEPLAVGNPSFMLPGDAAGREIGNTVFGWSLIGEVGAYTVHQSVRLRIRGPTFTVLHEDSSFVSRSRRAPIRCSAVPFRVMPTRA